MNKLTNFQLAIIVAFLSVFLFAIVGLELAGRDPENVIYLGAAVLIPAALNLVTNKTVSELKNENTELRKDVALIQKQTNGTTTSLVRIIADAGLGDKLPDAPPDDGPKHAAPNV